MKIKSCLILFSIFLCAQLCAQTFNVKVVRVEYPQGGDSPSLMDSAALEKCIKDFQIDEISLNLAVNESAKTANVQSMPYMTGFPNAKDAAGTLKFKDIGSILAVHLSRSSYEKGSIKSSGWFSSDDEDGKSEPQEKRLTMKVSFSVSEFEGFIEYGTGENAVGCPAVKEDYYDGIITVLLDKPFILKSGLTNIVGSEEGGEKRAKKNYFYAIMVKEVLPKPQPPKR